MMSQSRNLSGPAAVGDELKQDATRLKGDVASRAKQEAENRKGQAAQLASSASSALESAASDLRDNPDAPDWMESALRQAARSIEGLASHVEGRSIDQLGQEAADFARRNPGTFLIASAAAGFAVSRVLRAGVGKKRHDHASEQTGTVETGSEWPADENIQPTTSGGFAPAYAAGQTGQGELA